MGTPTNPDLPHESPDPFVLLYDELRAIAARLMLDEKFSHTLQPTAAVHEAWLRIARSRNADAIDTSNVKYVAVAVMRGLLVDYARRKRRHKRGGDRKRDSASELDRVADPASSRVDTLIDLDESLSRLARTDPESARIIELVAFGGLSHRETARMLHSAETTVRRRFHDGLEWIRQDRANRRKEDLDDE